MEGHLDYIVNIISTATGGVLRPVYGILRESELPEEELASAPGYRGMGPVRRGNAAYAQIQNDGYGSVILACAQGYFDRRLDHPGDEASQRPSIAPQARNLDFDFPIDIGHADFPRCRDRRAPDPITRFYREPESDDDGGFHLCKNL